LNANRTLNASRNEDQKYKNFFNSVVAKKRNVMKSKLEGSSGFASIPFGKINNNETKVEEEENMTKNVNRKYVLEILENKAKKYKNNNNKISAIVAYNPGLNFSKLARNNNNAKIKNLLARANIQRRNAGGSAPRLNNTL
jgi:hypothetical protein